MKNSAFDQSGGDAFLIVRSGRVTGVSGGFTGLTGYMEVEVSGSGIDALLSKLRLSNGAGGQLEQCGRAACWLFTKALEPREVTVMRRTDGDGAVYTFEEKPHSRLEEVLSYPCQLLHENMIGVSIYSAPDFTLLKANQTYLDFCDEPYRSPEKTFGRTIFEFIDGYKGSPAEEAVNSIFKTGKSEVIKELRFDHFKRGVTYWDQLITPVSTDGKIKYVVTNTQDVTERVAVRQQNEEQKKYIKKRDAQLAAIFENISVPLALLDKDGISTTLNRAGRALLLPLYPDADTPEGSPRVTQYYDTAGNPIHPDDIPCHRVRHGERVVNFTMAVKRGNSTAYMDVSGTPVYDDNGAFIAGLLSYSDMTAQVHSQKQYQSVFDAMQSGVAQYDSDGKVVSANQAAANILGILPEDAPGRAIEVQQHTIKEDGSNFSAEDYPVRLTLRTGKPVRNIIMGFFNAVRNEYRWLNISTVPLFHPGDMLPYQVFTIFDDITDRKKAEDALKKSEATLRSVLDHSGDFIYSLDARTNTYEYLSPSAAKVLGCSAETFATTDFATLLESIHPDDRPGFEAALAELDKKTETEIRFRQLMPDGEYRWFSNHLTDVKDENGEIIYHNGRIRDITAQVKSDEVIRYQAGLLQSISDIIISSDENDTIKSWNKAAELTFGWTEEEAIGQRIDTLLKTQFIGPSLEEAYNTLLQYGKVEMETIDTCKDGRKLNMRCSPQIIRDANGKKTGIVGIFRNVTEKIKMEEALRESELHLRLAAEGAKLGTYAFDFTKGTIFISDELKALWGLRPNESIEHDDQFFFKGLHPDDKQPFQEKIMAANNPDSDGTIELDYRVILPGGNVKALHMRGLTTFGDTGGLRRPVYATGVVIDITERVAAENSVRELSEELQNIIDSTDDYIYSVDREFRLVNYNSAFSVDIHRIFGIQIEKGMRLPEIMPKLDDAYWEDAFARVAGEGKFYLESGIDGGTRVMQFTFNPVHIDGQLVELTVFGKDITGRLNSEREIIRLNASLEKSVLERTGELQNSIGDLRNLSRIIIHDLKEPIRQIVHDAEHISAVTAIDGIRADAAAIKRTCFRMTRLIDSLSEYAMSSELKIKAENLNIRKMLTSVFNDLKKSAPNDAVLLFETGLPAVYADKVLMERVLYNLLSNAFKFSSKRAVSEITAGCMEENLQYIYYVRDNGIGFDMQYAHKLFGAFERLHADEGYEGTGIGLAAVRNIIRRHGGSTWIESQEGIGTTVYFTLPAESD